MIDHPVVDRLAGVPPFVLGFVLLSVLQSAVDLADPTAGDIERVLGLFLVAFAASGFLVALDRQPAPLAPVDPTLAWLLRRVLLAGAAALLLLALLGRAVGPLVDGVYLLGLLLLAATTLPLPRATGRLGRAAVPTALVAVGVSVVLVAVRLATVVASPLN